MIKKNNLTRKRNVDGCCIISVLFVIIITYCRDGTLDDRVVRIYRAVCVRLDVCEFDNDRRLADAGIDVIYDTSVKIFLSIFMFISFFYNTNVNQLIIIYKTNVMYLIILFLRS